MHLRLIKIRFWKMTNEVVFSFLIAKDITPLAGPLVRQLLTFGDICPESGGSTTLYISSPYIHLWLGTVLLAGKAVKRSNQLRHFCIRFIAEFN